VDLHRITAGDAVVVLNEDAVEAQHLSEEGDRASQFETASAGIAWTKDVCSVATIPAWSLLDEV
jgi:hypothetical protein